MWPNSRSSSPAVVVGIGAGPDPARSYKQGPHCTQRRLEARWLGAVRLVLAASLACAGCSALSVAQRNTLIGVGAVALAGRSPSSDLEQTYYLGTFDPQDQLPPALYRLRVRGQASFLSGVEFASGWVRAELVDSLTGSKELTEANPFMKAQGTPTADSGLVTGRRLVMFGPEGFREAPRNHRLVVVMGSSPAKFFEGIDSAMATVALARHGESGAALDKELFGTLLRLQAERERLDDVATIKEPAH